METGSGQGRRTIDAGGRCHIDGEGVLVRAVARDLTLVSKNVREFNRVDRLRVEYWRTR
jgi:hypothetical protein